MEIAEWDTHLIHHEGKSPNGIAIESQLDMIIFRPILVVVEAEAEANCKIARPFCLLFTIKLVLYFILGQSSIRVWEP